MPNIQSVRALEILDSRGRPTVKAYIQLSNGVQGAASVPSGASTGAAEAHELRDGDPDRYQGYGCLQAVSNVNHNIADALVGKTLLDQQELDTLLIKLDGTAQKSNLGANAILAVSLAYAKALAAQQQIPLYQYFRQLVPTDDQFLPRLTVNLFSGGKHAGGQIPIQDVLVIPKTADSIQNALAQTYRVYQAAANLIFETYQSRSLTADEGGLAPPFSDLKAMFEHAVAAINRGGFEAGDEIALALDVAASHFYVDDHYVLGGKQLNGAEMVQELTTWVKTYPIVSLEDGLAEEDWTHWTMLKKALQTNCLILGDDLLCTQTQRIHRAIKLQAANALLLKVNQVGTLTEAAAAFQVAKQAGWQVTVSARSGETEDNWLADLAVGWGANQIKVGSITQSERLTKYNRLLEIEAETKWPVRPWQR